MLQNDTNARLINYLKTGNRVLIGPLSENLQNSYQLASTAVIDIYTLVLVDATGMVAGTLFKMEELIDDLPSTFYATVLSVATNTLTLDRPVTPVIFAYINNFDKKVNVTRMMFNMVTTDSTPYNGFGDIDAPGLPRGIEIRKKNNDGTYTNYFNAKTNNRLDLLMFDLSFFDPTHPQAVNGMSGRFTFEKLGTKVILEKGEELQIIVQDNLLASTILSFEAVAEGNREQ